MARTINVKLILELRHSGMSINDIARSNHISKHSVCTVCRIAENLGITDEQVSNLSSEDLYLQIETINGHQGHDLRPSSAKTAARK